MEVRSGNTTRMRAGARTGDISRTQRNVAFSDRSDIEQRNRVVTRNRTGYRSDWRDRGDWDRDNDGDWRSGERRFRRPPTTIYRGWDRDRIYSWTNHRWHWFGGAWVIVDGSPDYYYYDDPVVTTYAYSGGSNVLDVQRALDREGYDPGPIDGVLGGQTRAAIAAFQSDNGLAATGRIDIALLDELGLR